MNELGLGLTHANSEMLVYTLKMLGCFNPTFGQIWTNPKVWLKMQLKNLTQWLGLSIFYPKLG